MKPAILWNDSLERSQPHVLRFAWKITAAKTVSNLQDHQPVLTAFDAIATQAAIDDYLGTTNEFLVAAFDSTAMGADTFAGIINAGGQIAKVLHFKAACYSGTDFVDLVQRGDYAAALMTASTLLTECAAGADGNAAFRVNFGNSPDFDGLTDGLIIVEMAVYLK